MTVNDILDFSKLEAGQVHIKPRATSPTKLAGDALNLFSLLASEKGLTLSAHDTDALPAFVSLDPDRVRQVLLNLLGNAVKFTTVGGVRLETTYDTSRGRITFAVVDSGAGIDADGIKQLFQRFSQVDGSTTRKYGGTGLGLAICKGLVEAMGGEIGVKSARGEGSRFWFSIPAEKVQSKAVIEAEHAARDIPGGCRVLVVDDHMANRALVRSLLAPYEVEITEAWDGLEAIDAAMSAPYDVILMDLRMPNMNGETAARRIRGVDGPNDATPIIALSADVMSGKANGLFADSVAKPISPATLILAISNATNSQSDCLAHAAL
jgi:CheY-like chemotaxis protein